MVLKLLRYLVIALVLTWILHGEDKTMKIVMLGHTGVGKTTYMASLYEAMQQKVEGFQLKTAKSLDHSRLLDLANMIRSAKYPPPTAHRDEYDFKLRYQNKDVLSFSWADYRGGALTEKTQSSDQVNSLIKDLKQADGIMMFCDCDALARGNLRSIQLARMMNFVNSAVQDVEHPIALSIILTKVDLIARFEKDLLSPFQNLIDVINASEWVLGAFVPISCGARLVNIPMPLLFTLHAAVILQAASTAHLAEEYYEEALLWEEKSQGISGFVRWLGNKLNGNPTDSQMAEFQMQKAVEKYQEFEVIKEPAEALINYVDKLPLIHEDKNVQSYVEELSKIKFGITINPSRPSSYIHTTDDPFDAF